MTGQTLFCPIKNSSRPILISQTYRKYLNKKKHENWSNRFEFGYKHENFIYILGKKGIRRTNQVGKLFRVPYLKKRKKKQNPYGVTLLSVCLFVFLSVCHDPFFNLIERNSGSLLKSCIKTGTQSLRIRVCCFSPVHCPVQALDTYVDCKSMPARSIVCSPTAILLPTIAC